MTNLGEQYEHLKILAVDNPDNLIAKRERNFLLLESSTDKDWLEEVEVDYFAITED